MRPEERQMNEFIIEQIRGMQKDFKELEDRLDENRKAELE